MIMTQEEKAKAYDRAFEIAKAWCKLDNNDLSNDDLETLFPSLKESEDERIRKWCISHFRECFRVTKDNVEYKEYLNNKVIPWLEKQGEQKSADKVEPKFKVGDWCIDNEDGVIFQIMKVLDNTYTYKTNDGKEYSCTHYSLENDAKLWTIQDARKGDVLACKGVIYLSHGYTKSYEQFHAYFGVSLNGTPSTFVNEYCCLAYKDEVLPATKEQRVLLFQKMKEAGYEWDAEKKELKKVEKKSQRMISAEAKEAMYDKPTDEDMKEALRTEYEKGRADAIAEMQKEWSDKEKQMYADIIEATKKSGIFKEAYKRELVDWLKSIKNRVIPQSKQEWSEEDEKKQKKNY